MPTVTVAVAPAAGQTLHVGFFERNRREVIEMGYDGDRLPPGQYLTDRFPVLHVGDVPTYAPGEWSLSVSGLVDRPYTMTFEELTSMPSITLTTDIHCVTKWSKFDTVWRGVRVVDILARAGVQQSATHLMGHAEFGYTANMPLVDAVRDECLVTWEFDGKPLEPIHGGPVRLLVPHLYFWKSPKWLRGLELIDRDKPGFWERNGYHMYGDPFLEQRVWGD
ncbi:MAG: sulfite oxidase-like oxidoreductase [Acidimicrobiales bacterium]